MNICFFGSYNPDYSRNSILIDGLKKNNVKVLECHSTSKGFLRRYFDLLRMYWRIKSQVDVIFVAFFGHLDMPLAWFLAKLTGKKLVFDMFYSMYDTYVLDRQSASPTSLRAKLYLTIDKTAASLADCIVTDTYAHAKYFVSLLNIRTSKFHRIFVGGNDELFKPLKKKKHTKKVKVEFHGMFTRLHGAEYYVEVAKKLETHENLEFYLIGSTSNYPLPIKLFKRLKPKNMFYKERMTLEKLAMTVRHCDISVGHVGTTKKANSVIANKTFEGLASKCAVIVQDSAANRELFEDKKTALFVTPGDTQDLAKKILFLSNNAQLRLTLAQNGYNLYTRRLTNKHVGLELKKVCMTQLA